MSNITDCTQGNANSTACVAQAQAAYDLALATSLGVNVAIFVVVMLLFMMVRKAFPWCYEPLCDKRIAGPLALRPVKRGVFGWFSSLYGLTDRELALRRGLDAVLMLRLCRYLFFIVGVYCFYAFLVLVPIHAVGPMNLTGTAIISMSNQRGAALAADLVGVYVASIVASVMLYILYRSYFSMRTRYRVTSLRPENFTVLVREFDRTLTVGDLKDEMEIVFPGKVHSIQKAYRVPQLVELIQEKEKIGKLLERAEAHLLKQKERPTARDCKFFYCCVGRKVDAINFFQSKFDALSQEIADMQRNPPPESAESGACFVTFKDRKTAQVAAQVVLKHTPLYYPIQKSWVSDAAPAPTTVLWENLHVSHIVRWLISLGVNVATFLLIFFWMIPIGFASSISNLTVLSQVFPFLIPVIAALPPAVKSFIEGLLPTLVVIIFFAILVDYILRPLSMLERQWSMAVVDRSVFNKFFLFQVFNIFLGSVLSTGFLKVLPQIIENPTSIINLLANALPQQAGYFTNLVMGMSMTSFALAMLRPAPLILGLIKHRFLAKTKRERRAARGPYFFDYSVLYAQMLLVFLIATTYSTMSPLVLPFALIYFGLCWMSTKYLVAFVCTPRNPAEGEMFPALFTRLCWCLVTFQIVLLGVLGGREFVASVAIVPLVVAQILFWLWTDKQFNAGAKYGALDGDAAAVFSKEEEYMKKKVETHMVLPLLDDGELPEVDIDTLVPAPHTYKYVAMREPLFELESQNPEEPALPVDPLFWRTEWVVAETGAPFELPNAPPENLRFRIGKHRASEASIEPDVL